MKIAYISDLNIKGSGYSHITTNLCQGLVELGHEVKVIALSYKREEHNFNFSVLPAENVQECVYIFHNLHHLWKADVVVVAIDVPIQNTFIKSLQQYNLPYIGIMPLETGPLCMSWAMHLLGMKKVFMISELATVEANKVGISAEHLQIGIDTESWRIPTEEESRAIRSALLGITDPETFVILTVADNQERKNLSAAMEMVAGYAKFNKNYRYILVTREHSSVGWALRDLAVSLGISDNFMVFERGLSFKQMWSLYAASDCFLLTSKGEGLGMPVLESMACGVPVVGTKCGAIIEHIEHGAGMLIEPAFVHIDTYGNANRYYASVGDGTNKLILADTLDMSAAVAKAREYVEGRTWDIPVQQLDKAIREAVK